VVDRSDDASCLLGLAGLAVERVALTALGVRVVQLVTHDPDAARCPACRVVSTSGKDWVLTRPHHLPCGGGLVARGRVGVLAGGDDHGGADQRVEPPSRGALSVFSRMYEELTRTPWTAHRTRSAISARSSADATETPSRTTSPSVWHPHRHCSPPTNTPDQGSHQPAHGCTQLSILGATRQISRRWPVNARQFLAAVVQMR
jgi:hypothetical protein